MFYVKTLVILVAITGMILGGCDSSADPSPSQLPKVTIPPPIGSVFIFETWEIDSTGNKVNGSKEIQTDSIVQSGITFEGKTNVVEFVSKYPSGLILHGYYFNIESNGDISQWVPVYTIGGEKRMWIRYPIYSQSTNNVTLVDTTYVSGGISTTLKQTSTLIFEGEHSVVVSDTSVQGAKIRTEAVSSVTTDGLNRSFTMRTFDAFAPTIAFWSYQYMEPYKSFDNKTSNGNLSTLVSYTLR